MPDQYYTSRLAGFHVKKDTFLRASGCGKVSISCALKRRFPQSAAQLAFSAPLGFLQALQGVHVSAGFALFGFFSL